MDSLFAVPGGPLPGTAPPVRALFIDRWGTLLEQPAKGYCKKFSDVVFTPGALDALFRAHQAGWKLYLIGNECQVAFGKQSKKSWESFERDLLAHLHAYGVPITRNYACIDHPEGQDAHARDSVFLLPNTGALYHAAQREGVALSESWVVGDSSLELVCGWRGGCRLASVGTGLALRDGEYEVDPEIRAANLAEVVSELTIAERIAR